MRFVLGLILAVQTPPSSGPRLDTAHIVIVATTDVHGRALGWDYVQDRAAPGGLSRAAAILATLARAISRPGDPRGRRRSARRERVRELLRARGTAPPRPAGGRPQRPAIRRGDARQSRLRLRSRPAGERRQRRRVPLRQRQRGGGSPGFPPVSGDPGGAARRGPRRDHRPHDARGDGLGPAAARRPGARTSGRRGGSSGARCTGPGARGPEGRADSQRHGRAVLLRHHGNRTGKRRGGVGAHDAAPGRGRRGPHAPGNA